jgi:hypothetical protein
MSSSTTRFPFVRAEDVTVTEDALAAELFDECSIFVPLAWYRRPVHGKPGERSNWRLVSQGVGLHWPALDEGISVENLLAGQASGESQRSLKKWLSQRASSR